MPTVSTASTRFPGTGSAKHKSPRKEIDDIYAKRVLIREYCEVGWWEAALLQLQSLITSWEWPDVWRWGQALMALDASNAGAVIEKIGKEHPVKLLRLQRWTLLGRLGRWGELQTELEAECERRHEEQNPSHYSPQVLLKCPPGYAPLQLSDALLQARMLDLRAQALMACGQASRVKEVYEEIPVPYNALAQHRLGDPRARIAANQTSPTWSSACEALDEHGDGEAALLLTAPQIASLPLHTSPLWDPWLALHAEALQATGRHAQLQRLARHLVNYHPQRAIAWYVVYLAKQGQEGKIKSADPLPSFEAPRYLLKALARDEGFLPAWLALAHHLSELGDVDHAGGCLLHTHRHLAPASPLVLGKLASHWLNQRQPEIASAYLVEAYGLIKDSPIEGVSILETIGLVYQQRGELIKAERMLQAACEREERKRKPRSLTRLLLYLAQVQMAARKDTVQMEITHLQLSKCDYQAEPEGLRVMVELGSVVNSVYARELLRTDLDRVLASHPTLFTTERLKQLEALLEDRDAMDIEE